MKKRNTTIFAFLLLAAVGMGVGYAALSDEVKLGGEIGVIKDDDAWEANIHFDSSVQLTGKGSVTYSADTESNPNDVAQITISGMDTKNEELEFVLKIVNQNTDYDAAITASTVNKTFGPYTKDTDFNIDVALSDTTIPAGGSIDVTVTVKLLVQPTENLSATFNVTYTAAAVDPR